MFRNIIKISFIISAFIAFNNLSFAKEVTIGFSKEFPPYVMYQNGKLTGIDVEIVKEAFKSQGYTVKAKQYYYDEFYPALKNKKVDGTSTTITPENEKEQFSYSKPYLKFENVVITRKKDNIKVNSIADLKDVSIVGWYKAYKTLGKDFEKKYSPHISDNQSHLYHEKINQFEQVKEFFAGKEQAIVVDIYVYLWFKSQLIAQGFKPAEQEVDIHWIFPEKTIYSAAFIDSELKATFDKGISELKKNGRINAIEAKFQHCDNYHIPETSKDCAIHTKK